MGNIETSNFNDIEIKVHNTQEWKKFKEITTEYGLNPKKELLKIQDEMIKQGKMPKNEKGHFGPKTIEYLNTVYYPNLETKKFTKFTKDNPTGKEVQKKYKKYLDNINENTNNAFRNTINTTRKRFSGIHDEGFFGIHDGSIDFSYQNPHKEQIGDITNENIVYGYSNFIDKKGNEIKINNNYSYQLKKQLDKYKGTGKTPVEALAEIYKNAPEKEKIQMAQVLGTYMLDHYDHDMNNNNDLKDISSEEMWKIYAKGGVAGVCRHIHSEVAKFLEKSGITAGVITTNSGERHAITVGKLKNGKYFFIDYGTYYEAKNLMDLKNNYLAQYGQIDFKEYIGKADGEVVKVIQTALEKKLEETTSSSGVGDIMILSKNIAKNGWEIKEGWNVDVKASNQDNKFNISYGTDTKYGKYGIEAFYNKTTGLGFSDYTSYGLGLKTSWGNKYDKYGELGLGLKYSKNHFSWEKYKTTKDLNTLSANVNYSRNLLNTETDQINIGAAIEGGIMWNENKINDGYGKLATTVDWEHKINNNWSTELYGSIGADIGFKNIRDNRISKLTLYPKYGIGGAIIYNDKDLIAKLKAGYEKGMGYYKYKVGAELKKGKLKIKGSYSKEKDTSFLKLPSKTSAQIGVKYNVNNTLKTYIKYKYENNYGNKNQKISAGFQYKF